MATKRAPNGYSSHSVASPTLGSGLLRGRLAHPTDQRRDLGAAADSQLAQDAADVGLGGVLADEQLLRDLAVGLALGDERQDPPLLPREHRQRVVRGPAQ